MTESPETKPEPAAGKAASDQAKEMLSGFASAVGEQSKTGEGRIALSGAAIFVIWVIFDVAIQSYGFNNTLAVLGVTAFVVPRVNEDVYEPLPRRLIMMAIGSFIVVFGAIELILDVRNSVLSDAGAAAGAVFSYLAYGLALWGVLAIKAEHDR